MPTARVAREGRRMGGTLSFAVGDLDGSRSIWRGVLEDPESSEGDRSLAADWLARIAWTRSRPE
jgi:hypothetical protein